MIICDKESNVTPCISHIKLICNGSEKDARDNDVPG